MSVDFSVIVRLFPFFGETEQFADLFYFSIVTGYTDKPISIASWMNTVLLVRTLQQEQILGLLGILTKKENTTSR